MVRTTLIIGFLSFAFAFNSYANDSDRIDQLEKEVHEAKARLSKLEALLGNPAATQGPVTSDEGWKSVMNWRKLSTGMSTGEVRKILGEPDRLDGGRVASWHYRNDGEVIFFNEKVSQWREPRQ